MTVLAKATVSFSARAAAAMSMPTPNGWEQRWKDIERELATVRQRRSNGMRAVSISEAVRQLRSFWVLAYHLKDALIAEEATTRVARTTIESEITADPNLALLADLANLDKHGRLERPPRSGHVPRLGEARAVSDLDRAGWELQLEVVHDGQQLDGLSIAIAAMTAWRRLLVGWKLI